jgi:hypothetical protein
MRRIMMIRLAGLTRRIYDGSQAFEQYILACENIPV